MGFVAVLKRFASWRDLNRPSIAEATVAVSEQYARRKLRIKRDQPLEYRGLRLRCIGTKAWRLRHLS